MVANGKLFGGAERAGFPVDVAIETLTAFSFHFPAQRFLRLVKAMDRNDWWLATNLMNKSGRKGRPHYWCLKALYQGLKGLDGCPPYFPRMSPVLGHDAKFTAELLARAAIGHGSDLPLSICPSSICQATYQAGSSFSMPPSATSGCVVKRALPNAAVGTPRAG